MTSVNEMNAYERGKRELAEEIKTIVNKQPEVELSIYLEVVKDGNKDDMFDLGVSSLKEAVLKVL